MALNFNVSPYYDDFDAEKNFHRILFKPGYAVQGRELTQSQTILQNQITSFADNIFKQNSPVSGGQVTTNFNCFYVKIQDTFNDAAIDVNNFNGLLVQDATGTVVARVLQVSPSTGDGGDPPTLVVSYLSGNHFTDGMVIYDTASNLACQAIVSAATGNSSVASIEQGVFYVLGNFVQISASTVILSKYSKTPSVRVGITYTETIQDYVDDPSLLDPAIGASNYQAPGADRYVITLTLSTRPLEFGDDSDFIELTRITNGEVAKIVDGSVYNVIDDYFAKRDYETNGDYVVNDFKLTPKTNVNPDLYTMSVGKGIAYVHGYRVESPTPVELVSDRARTTESQGNNPVFIDFGSYFYVDNVKGANTGYFDITTPQTIDLHCVSKANVNIAQANTYSSTKVGTGYIRGLVYDSASNTSNSSTFIYKAYVNDIQNAVPTANAVSGTAGSITLPSYFSSVNDAYVGVNISITNGTSAGDFRTITAYNGATKTANVNQNWTVTPTTSSVFALNFDTKDIETVLYTNNTFPNAQILASASINSQSVINGSTVLENPNIPEMVFTVGSPYVAAVSDTSYTTQQVSRNVAFTVSGGAVTAQLNYEGAYLDIIRHFGTPGTVVSSDVVRQNYTIIVTDKGSNSTINVGDVVVWTSSGRTITLDDDASIATLAATDLSPFTATIIEKVFVSNGDAPSHILKYKNLITANTSAISTSNTQVATYTYVDDTTLTSKGQVYIKKAGLVAPGQKQSLYLSDVKLVRKVIDTKDANTAPTVAMINSSTHDITNNYIFDNGQRDSYYDHASLTLRPGAPQPQGNILVFLDYYQHSGGDGYFSIESYTTSTLQENYREIPSYTSRHGTTYALRDSLDFRPARLNAQTAFEYRYSQPADTRHGVFLPVDLSIFTCDYQFYLGRKDKLVLSKDRSFEIIQGTPSLTPLFPTEPDGSLVIAQLTHTPYTGYIPTEAPNGIVADLSVQKVKHKRYTMQDIAGLENRINNVEYYTSLSMLEQKAQTLQISDAYGLNRFKNGILVDDFSSFATADTLNIDYAAAVNRRERKMSATHQVQNFPLKSLALAYNMGKTSSSQDSLGYAISTDGYVNYFSLPYTTTEAISQKLASRTVNVNPFSFSITQGITALSPNIDNWVDTKYAPALLIIDDSLQVFRANSQSLNVLSAGDWQTVSGTSATSAINQENHQAQDWGFGLGVGQQTTTTVTSLNQVRTDVLGAYDRVGNTYAFENNYITDISILPYIRKQQIVVRAGGMLINTNVNTWFDLSDVKNYVRKTNVIELTNVTGTFKEDDILGYYVGGVFTPTARVVGVYDYPNNNNIRLYVAADGRTSAYTVSGTIQNAFFNSSGVYQSSTASGTVASTKHYGGVVKTLDLANNKVKLAATASATDGLYTGNTIYFCAGTAQGQSATIANYYAANQIAVLSTTVSPTANVDLYSIGSFNTDESGYFYGIFNLPENTFHTGQRVFRVDNSTGGNVDSATTYAEGTFYSEGLQATAQSINFGASPAGAKNTFTQTSQRTITNVSTTISPWDPVAQSFIVTKDAYPNGLFIKSAKFFFASKPTSDNSPIQLSIVGTQNGYPNGDTLDQSIVTLTPQQVVVSQNPQFADATTYTTFEFSVPIYIQPGYLYAFILKSNSKEYTLWSALNGDTALKSSVKNLPTDPDPSTTTKIGSAPYVGALFLSQNSQTWTAEQNQALMFVVDRCVFNTATTPNIQYVVPAKLPQRTLVDQSVDYYVNANTISTTIDAVANTDVYVDAFNITTTDFTPTTTNISYAYNATLLNGTAAGTTAITPGKYGTATPDNIFLNDGKGERVLLNNSNTSLSVYATLSSGDSAVSPIISDAGLTTYTIKWNINNCELSNNLINIVSGGTGYNANAVSVTISSDYGSGATAVANVANGVITNVYITNGGSGYITTPTITISNPATRSGNANAVVTITGETSKNGGPALAKYITKKVVLDAGFDSGDINVYLTAYRPVNTDINVYYKILSRNDTQLFDDGSWQLMTPIKNSGALYSQSRTDLYEYTFAPGTNGTSQGYVTYTSTNGQTYTTFSQFAIKVVMTSSDHTFTPFATDLRVLALPADVNTTA